MRAPRSASNVPYASSQTSKRRAFLSVSKRAGRELGIDGDADVVVIGHIVVVVVAAPPQLLALY
jgi:hypothetical protein